MNVLLLSPYPEKIVNIIAETDSVSSTAEAITLDFVQKLKTDLIVSYGYRHLIKEPLLSAYRNKIINLHISYLPWNRGADPNFWSWYEQTPNGISIHYIDAGIDTGPILVQKEVTFPGGQTLDSSSAILKRSIELMFKDNWHLLRVGKISPLPQKSKGTYHASKDKEKIFQHLPLKGQTPVEVIIEMGKRRKL